MSARRTPPLYELHGDPSPAQGPLKFLLGCLVVLFTLLGVALVFFPPALQVQSAHLHCAVPTEHETRLVYINARPDGTIEVTCGPAVGGSTNYGTRRR